MKRTMLSAVIGGAMALIASVITAEAAPVSAVQAGKSAQSGEVLVQKAGWRHRRHYYGRRHYRPYYSHSYRRHYRPRYRHYGYRSHWRPHHHYYGRHTYRHHRRHYH